MKPDLLPLFLKKNEDGELEYCGVVITVDGECYKPSSFIGQIAESIEEDVEGLVTAKEMGELTVSAYLLLESLHRAGLVKTSNALLMDTSTLLQSATCFAIGMKAGMVLGDLGDVNFETTRSDSNLSIRDVTTNEDEDSDCPSCS